MSTATISEAFYKGALIHMAAGFASAAGVAVDPTVVGFTYRKPGGVDTTTLYGAGTVVKTATGAYYVDLSADTVGTWYYKWYSTGTGQAAVEGTFTVSKSKFT
jgi:hypothetical protein